MHRRGAARPRTPRLGEDAEEVAARDRRLAEALAADQPLVEAEEPFTARGGRTRWFQTVRSPLRLSPKSGPLVLTFGVDVSERRELGARLRRIERLEAVGQLAGGVAHDFNNLLMVVLGHADLLLGQPEVSG